MQAWSNLNQQQSWIGVMKVRLQLALPFKTVEYWAKLAISIAL